MCVCGGVKGSINKYNSVIISLLLCVYVCINTGPFLSCLGSGCAGNHAEHPCVCVKVPLQPEQPDICRKDKQQ